MSKIGYGYGSEWHLLRYLGYRRSLLNRSVVNCIAGDSVELLDFPFSPTNAPCAMSRTGSGLIFFKMRAYAMSGLSSGRRPERSTIGTLSARYAWVDERSGSWLRRKRTSGN